MRTGLCTLTATMADSNQPTFSATPQSTVTVQPQSSSTSATPDPSGVHPEEATGILKDIAAQLDRLEKRICNATVAAFRNERPGRDRAICDQISGIYTHSYLHPCLSAGVASRAARFSREVLVPAVLNLEAETKSEFHKGALFYDTALAHLLSGDQDGFEFFLAMTDEEEVKTTGGSHSRGSLNLRAAGLTKQTLTDRLEFACKLLNGKIAGCPVDFHFATGLAPIDAAQFDQWRQRLDALHQFELLRFIHDIEMFSGDKYSSYSPVKDDPFVLLRLAKALSHVAQWVESCLSYWQKYAISGTLRGKLLGDPSFGNLTVAAGSPDLFAGNCPKGGNVDPELDKLLANVTAMPPGAQREWIILRILYIVRNATAHTIDPSLMFYRDRQKLLSFIQVIGISVFVVAKLKNEPIP
jgi:hypothetical protein